MKAVIQQVSQAAVSVDQQKIEKISCGLLILLGIRETDMPKNVEYLVKKIAQVRTFEDDQGKMSISVEGVGDQILNVSQFILFTDTKKGSQPSSVEATQPGTAIPLYEPFNEGIRSRSIAVTTGQFGADMSISLVSDGPVTIIIDSKNKQSQLIFTNKKYRPGRLSQTEKP